MKKRRYVRLAFLALAAVVAAWLLPSLISAERYRRRLQANLQQALGRQVRFGAISFRLIPRPGFSIENATVLEDRAFGAEAFARVDHIDCDLAVSSILKARIALARLHLQGAAINLVRNASGKWNVERITWGAASPPAGGGAAPNLAVELDGGRLNFKLGADKKPFAITGLKGRVQIDRRQGKFDFDLSGAPVRTDLSLPTPGPIEVQGSWSSGGVPEGSLTATLRSRDALVYDWVPILLNRNPGIYGLADVEARLTGSLAVLDIDAQARLSQLRRWESLPPTGDLPVSLSLQAQLDRKAGEARISSLKADFGSSHLNLRGKLTRLGPEPELDLLAAATNSRLDDFVAFGTRFKSSAASAAPRLGLAGNVDGLVAIRAPWSQARLSGSISTSKVHLAVGHTRLPVADALLQCEGRQINLLPAKITVGPRVSLLADGVLHLPDSEQPRLPVRTRTVRKRAPGPVPFYRLSVSAHAVPGHDLVSFARSVGLGVASDLDVQGPITATVTVASLSGLQGKPAVSGFAEFHDDKLLLPGLVQPVAIRDARMNLEGDRLVIDPITAVFGGSVITARIGHAGAGSQPWTFEAHSTELDMAEALSWFEAIGHRAPVSWFDRIPGLDTFAERSAAGTGLLSALNVRGEFSTPVLNYRGLSLRSFSARTEISKRDLRVTAAIFRVSSGKGQASANFDLTGPIPHLATDFDLQGLRVEDWRAHLPPQLEELRGSAGFSGRFSSHGNTREQLENNLEGRAQLHLANLDFGRFDPLRAAAQAAAWGDLAPGRVSLRSANLRLVVHDRRAELEPASLKFSGALFELAGACDFTGAAQLESAVDLRHVDRRWREDSDSAAARTARFLLSGNLDALRATIEDPSAQARR